LRLGGRVLRLQHGDARTQGIALAPGAWIDWRTLPAVSSANTADAPDAVWLSVSDGG